ncbi:hypothetical protein LCGC14_3103960 [marine sediment metagenome]|uniref:Uncharacterized protein n=1 Tax=marine sediment metagenome TaxID=412755 RepID=A0A0F8YEG9_9ZZZZ
MEKAFDNVFEKERKKFERRLGIKLTQRKFTEFLAKRKATFKFPKQNNKFIPLETKKTRRKKSNLDLF